MVMLTLIGVWADSLMQRMIDGLGSNKYKPVDYARLKALASEKKFASLKTSMKLKKIEQISQANKESSILKQHQLVWQKEFVRLQHLRRKVSQTVGWGNGLAQWLERWTGDPKVEGLNPVRSTRKTWFFFQSPKGCADSLSVSPIPVCYMHAYERPCTHVKDPVVHVGVHENNQHAYVPPNIPEDGMWLPKWRRN